MKRTIFIIMAVLSVFAMIMAGCGDKNETGQDSKKYTVSFETNGGGKIDAITDAASGKTITKPTDPEKANFTLEGWYKEKELTNKWDFDSDKVTGNITLYAKWTKTKPDANPDDPNQKNYFIVTFVVDGTTINSFDISSGEKIVKPVDPVKDNYYFDGWYDTDVPATQKKWFFDTRGVTNDVTLYAKFSPITDAPYTVRFSADGKLHKTQGKLESGAKLTRPEAPEKEDYDFAGWYKEEECTNQWNFSNDTVTRNLTLYAKFTPVVDDEPEDLARAEKVTLANAWYIIYQIKLPAGKTTSDYKHLIASYNFTKTALKNGVARGARLMGPYPKEFFTYCMGTASGSAPGKGLAIASFNTANSKYILYNRKPTGDWGKEGPKDNGSLKTALESALGVVSPCEWFELTYPIDGTDKHDDYGKDVTLGGSDGILYYGLGLPGQGPSEDQGACSNTFYMRDVKLVGNAGTDDVVGTPVYFKYNNYLWPAYAGYFNTNGSAGHKEASREMVDGSQPEPITVDWKTNLDP